MGVFVFCVAWLVELCSLFVGCFMVWAIAVAVFFFCYPVRHCYGVSTDDAGAGVIVARTWHSAAREGRRETSTVTPQKSPH